MSFSMIDINYLKRYTTGKSFLLIIFETSDKKEITFFNIAIRELDAYCFIYDPR